MQAGSPRWVESALSERVDRVVRWLDVTVASRPATPFDRIWPWVLAAVFLSAWWFTPRFGIPQALDFGSRATVVPLAFGLALICGLIRELKFSDYAKELACIALCFFFYAVLVSYLRGPWALRTTRFYIELVVPLALFAMPVPERYRSWKITTGFIFLLLIPFSSAMYEFIFLGRRGQLRSVQIRYLVPVMLPLMAWMAVQARAGRREWTKAFAILLSPAQMLSKTPLLPDYLKDERGPRTRFWGLCLILVGAVHLWLMINMFPTFLRMESRPPRDFVDFLTIGFTSYLRFYFFVYGASSMTRGIFFLMGFNVPPFFNFALLSSTPQDRWRRWDIPVYLTYRLFIFTPVYRRTGSLLLGIFLTFAVVASSYIFQPVFLLLSRAWATNFFAIEKIYAFYGLQALFVYFGLRTQRWWPSADSRLGWLGVAFTALLMSVCYGVRHLPFRWFASL